MRSDNQIREHYDIERKLAERLRTATKDERRTLYTTLYEELFRLVPHHDQLTRKVSPPEKRKYVDYQLGLLRRFLTPNTSFLEIGPGDCALVFEASKLVRNAYAVDVSPTVTESESVPENFRLFISDGCSIPVQEGTIDVIYSNQLMEHLHPEDAVEQLGNVLRALGPSGVYLCCTPNRLSGPHDISRDFANVAEGFHLKEYTVTELTRLFKEVGFDQVKLFASIRRRFFRLPILFVVMLESLLEALPTELRRSLARSAIVEKIISIKLVGLKK